MALMSRLSEAKHHIEVEADMDELDLTSAEANATYNEIRDWVKAHFGMHVTNVSIAQVKHLYALLAENIGIDYLTLSVPLDIYILHV